MEKVLKLRVDKKTHDVFVDSSLVWVPAEVVAEVLGGCFFSDAPFERIRASQVGQKYADQEVKLVANRNMIGEPWYLANHGIHLISDVRPNTGVKVEISYK